MTTMRPASWLYAEEFVPENEVMTQARIRGEQFGASPVGSGTGPFLRMIAASLPARAAVEIGTGAGVSGLWLLEGMPSDGVLTTIDISKEHQQAARQAYAAAGIPSQRTRTITGSALEVMPRLTDAAYDLVLIDGDKTQYPLYAEQAIRLLRPGGVMLLDNMLWHDNVADPAVRDDRTTILRDLGKQLRDDERLHVALIPAGDGLLSAVKR